MKPPADASPTSGFNKFYEIYSNTDFMKNFELIAEDHKEFTNGTLISLRCKAIKKFLPYEGFYPCQRTADIAKRFHDSFKDDIVVTNTNNVHLQGFKFGAQPILQPLFAPGVLFNTIKSGIAVDFPIMTSNEKFARVISPSNTEGEKVASDFGKRIPFEALVEPVKYLSQYPITSQEPDDASFMQCSASWTGDGDPLGLYSKMANNFLAESINFFLRNGQLSSVVSKKQKDIKLESGQVYGMRIKMRRSMTGSRGAVYHYTSASLPYYPPQDISMGTGDSALRETFTMYSRPSGFGPPSHGKVFKQFLGRGPEPVPSEPDSYTTLYNLQSGSFDPRNFTFHRFVTAETENEGPTGDELLLNTSSFTYDCPDSNKGYNYPYTPPYYHGESYCHIYFTASSDSMTIKEIQDASTYEYTRFDNSFILLTSLSGGTFSPIDGTLPDVGPQAFSNLDRNAMQLSASLNVRGVGATQISRLGAQAGNLLVVDSGLEEENRWIIQTKFETPMLNFNHVTSPNYLTLPFEGSASVPRGMWHQYGRIPEQNEGVFLQVGPIPDNYQTQVMNFTSSIRDMSEVLGFSGVGTKLGRLASARTIHEAVVAVPFVEELGRKKFFKLPLSEQQFDNYVAGNIATLTTGPAQSQIGRSVLNQMNKMKKYIFPPSFDFLNFPEVDPIAMYIFEFSHTLDQTDLQDIWQNLPPTIGEEMEISEVAITHPLLKKELLGQGGEDGNTTIDLPSRLKWMVFKVKQRAASSYFKKTVLRNSDINSEKQSVNVSQDEFGPTDTFQYNWPYDFFSLVEMVKIDSEVEMGNVDLSEYVDHISTWDPVEAEDPRDTMFGIEDDPLPDMSLGMEVGLPIGAIESSTSDPFGGLLENQQAFEQGGAADLANRSQDFQEREQDILDATLSELQPDLEGRFGPVDTRSFMDFVNTVPTSAVLQAGIPMAQFRNIANQAASLANSYQAAITTYGVNSIQANQARDQLQLAMQPIQGTALGGSLMSALNLNFNTGPGYNQ